MNYFQLNDFEGDSMGILCTSLKEPEIQEEWTNYLKEENDNHHVEEFIEKLEMKFPNMEMHRFFIDTEINP